MYFEWGNYRHPRDEVNLVSFEGRMRRSPRGKPMEIDYHMNVVGDIVATGQATINDRIQELLNAYSVPFQNAGLIHDDLTRTRHYLENNHADNVTGNHLVVHDWPKGEAEEYITQRTFRLSIFATYRYLESELIDWHEHVRVIGNCGPIYRYVPSDSGLWTRQIIYPNSVQEIVQTGFCEGYSQYLPLYIPGPLYPALEDQDQRRISTYGPYSRGRQLTNWRFEWEYLMHSDVPQPGFPNTVIP